jgi:hypothetical protein
MVKLIFLNELSMPSMTICAIMGLFSVLDLWIDESIIRFE